MYPVVSKNLSFGFYAVSGSCNFLVLSFIYVNLYDVGILSRCWCSGHKTAVSMYLTSDII